MRVIGILSGKGGVGKTTLAVNLSMAMSQFQRKVVLIDCNLTTAHLGFNFGFVYYPKTLNDVLKNQAKIREATYVFENLKIIPASIRIDDISGLDIDNLGEHIKDLSDEDVVILDSAPGIGKEAITVLKNSQEIIFVTIPYLSAIADVVRYNKILPEFGAKPLGIVLNMISKNYYEIPADRIEKMTGLPVIAKIPFDKNVQKSLAVGKPLILNNPTSKASVEIKKLAADLLGEKYFPNRLSKLYYYFRNFWY